MAALIDTPRLAVEIPALSFLYPFEWENQWVRLLHVHINVCGGDCSDVWKEEGRRLDDMRVTLDGL